MNVLRLKQKRILIDLMRKFFINQGFFELETPLLVPSPGMEVHLHGFKTTYLDQHGKSQQCYLPTSPEFALKKALGAGFEKVFEIARVFRNQGELGPRHHPEFNMLEWYRPGNYEDIMDDVAVLLLYLSRHFVDINTPAGFSWDQGVLRSSVQECFARYTGLDLVKGLEDLTYWLASARQVLNELIPDNESFDDIFFRVWIAFIEPKLGIDQPEIVYDYPASMAALSNIKGSDPRWAERFELYIQGVEIGNAFSELTDSQEQIRRYKSANQEREILGYPPHPLDEDLISAVGKMKPTGGVAIGVERLLMVLTGESDIRKFFLQPFYGSEGATNRT